MDGSSKCQQGVGATRAAETESTAPVGLRMSLVCLDIAAGSQGMSSPVSSSSECLARVEQPQSVGAGEHLRKT